MRLDLAAFALCAALLTASMHFAQEPSARKPTPRKPTGDVIDQMQGGWKLVEFRSRMVREERRQEAGYCLVSGIYMSLEIHLGWMGDENLIAAVDHTSGIHRLELTAQNRVRTSSLIGSFLNKSGKHQFEEPGKSRVLSVTVVGGRMTLEREDGNEYVFEKLGDSRERTDFYGRVIKEKPKETAPPKDEESPRDHDE